MNDDQNYKLLHLIESIDTSLKDLKKDNFFTNFYDGVIIGVTSGIISGLILLTFTNLLN